MKINKVLIIIAIILAGLQVFVSNKYNTNSSNIAKLEVQIKDARDENERLETKIASESSIMIINSKAESMGFSVHPPFYYLGQPLPVALSNSSPNLK